MKFKDIFVTNSTDTREGVVAGSPVYSTKIFTSWDKVCQSMLDDLQSDIDASDLVEARINGDVVMRSGEQERYNNLTSMEVDKFKELYGYEQVCIAIECATGTIYHELHRFSVPMD